MFSAIRKKYHIPAEKNIIYLSIIYDEEIYFLILFLAMTDLEKVLYSLYVTLNKVRKTQNIFMILCQIQQKKKKKF